MTPRDLIEKLWTAAWEQWSGMLRILNRFLDTPFSYMAGVIGMMVYLVALVLVPYGIIQWVGFIRWKRKVRRTRQRVWEEGSMTLCHLNDLTWTEYRRQRREESESE